MTGMFLQYLSFLLLFLGIIRGQQCCVSIKNTTMTSTPTVPPDSSCSGFYAWEPCSDGCKTVTCSCLSDGPGDAPYYSAECNPSFTNYTIKEGFCIGPGICNTSAGNSKEAAASGPASGSIAGTLLASALSLFLSNHGHTGPATI